MKGHNGRVRGIVWSADDQKLISCGTDGAVYEWEVATGKRSAIRKFLKSSSLCSEFKNRFSREPSTHLLLCPWLVKHSPQLQTVHFVNFMRAKFCAQLIFLHQSTAVPCLGPENFYWRFSAQTPLTEKKDNRSIQQQMVLWSVFEFPWLIHQKFRLEVHKLAANCWLVHASFF